MVGMFACMTCPMGDATVPQPYPFPDPGPDTDPDPEPDSDPETESVLDPDPDCKSRRRGCYPCQPNVGSIGYTEVHMNGKSHHNKLRNLRKRGLDGVPSGYISTPHIHLSTVEQTDYPDCECIWRDTNYVFPGSDTSPFWDANKGPWGGGHSDNYLRFWKMSELLEFFSEWIFRNCDGLWEHSYGMKIESLDNPGFFVEFDIFKTNMEKINFQEVIWESSSDPDSDWLECRVEGSKWRSACSVNNLSRVISIFKNWVEQNA